MKELLLPLCCSLTILQSTALEAAEGDLDPTWGGTGVVTTTFPGDATDAASALALQPDGKVLVAGSSSAAFGADFALVRYNSNGSLDATFNGTGRVRTNFGASEGARSIALQSNGNILLGGSTGSNSNTRIALARYNPDGSLDTSFNGTGMITLDLTLGPDEIHDLTLQSDGKIVATGVTDNSSLLVFRLNIDGSYDTSFNGNGRVTAGTAIGRSVALQPDGRIVVGAIGPEDVLGGFSDFVAVRFNADGTPDMSFNGTGRVKTPVSSTEDIASSVAVQADGKIVLGGTARDGYNKFAVVRYNADGSLDTSFNGTGKVITAVGTQQDFGHTLTLQNDGKILVAGTTYNVARGNPDFALLRYNINGSLDTTFHADGKVTTHIDTSDEGRAIEVQPDGRIMIGGNTRIGSGGDLGDFAVLRYIAVPEPGSSVLAVSAGLFLLTRRFRTR